MNNVLHISSDLTLLTFSQMNLIRGGDNDSLEDGLPTLPTLPASTSPTPDYAAANEQHGKQGQHGKKGQHGQNGQKG